MEPQRVSLTSLVPGATVNDYERTTEALDQLTESLQDDEVKRGDHIIVTDRDGDKTKWLVVWTDDHDVLACEIKRGCNCCGVFAPRPWNHRESHTYESGIDLRNPQEFTVDGVTVRKEQADV